DEYVSDIFMGGKHTLTTYNVCEDSLLAVPLMIDLVVLMELFQRVKYQTVDADGFQPLHPIASLLSYMLKAPVVPARAAVVNALGPQRRALENILRACVGLQPVNELELENKAYRDF
ncbi:NAD(P)-binding protein, partial [Caulochytrium protostelioides]